MRGRVLRRGAGWAYQVDLPPDPATGKRRQRLKGGFPTKREAERALTAMLGEVESGSIVGTSKQTLAEWLESWLAAVSPSLRPTTAGTYELAIRSWIVPRIGALRLQQVSPQVLQNLYAELRTSGRANGSGGLSPRSIRMAHQIVEDV